MPIRLRVPDVEPLTRYRLMAALGAVALVSAGLVNPSDADVVAVTRYTAAFALLALLVGSFYWGTLRRHIGWGAYLADVAIVVYLCSMLYTTGVDADSVVASFVGVLICGMVLHRVVLVVAFLSTALAIHVLTAYWVPEPVISPLSLTVNMVLYSVFVASLLCMQIVSSERRRDTESIMSAIFDQSSDALLYGDPSSDEIMRVNRRAEQLFDSRDPDQIGRLTRRPVQAKYSGASLEEVLARALEDPRWGEVCEFTAASGRRFWGNVALRRLAVPGRRLMMARITDVTEERERQAALEAAKEAAETAARTRSQFLANMSHEIRTPMNGVIGMTSLLLKTPLDDEQKRYVEIVRTSGESLLAIINEILDFSKIEAHQVRLEHRRFDLEELAVDALHVVSPQAAGKELELLLRMRPGQPRYFFGDPQRLRQVLVNLLANAVKFTQQGEVVLGVDVMSPANGRAELKFQVLDTGIGIDPAAVASLFQPFVQADASTTRRYGGTGLGLSISKSLVELMGGEISVDSEPGSGSVFSFVVPVESAPARSAGEGGELRGRRALVVQENARAGEVLNGTLRSAGMAAELFATAAAALASYRPGGCDVIIADARMSGMDGMELAQTLARLDPGRPPVILLAPLESREAPAAEVATMLRKPVRPSHLLQTVAFVLGIDGEGIAPDRVDALARPDFAGLRVLVAEDNPVNQLVVRQMLDKLGVSADVVADGQQAVDAVRRASYDVVLMDMQMPGKDGLQATREIRAIWGPSLGIVAMTANAQASDRQACFEAGMDDFLAKPVRLDDLEQCLRERIAGQRAVGTVAE